MRIVVWFWSVIFCGSWMEVRALPLATEPPLAQAFPLVDSPEGVRVSVPILLNLQTIIPTNVILRVIYLKPQPPEPKIIKTGREVDRDAAYSRNAPGTLPSDDHAKIPPEVVAAMKIARNTIWPTAMMFQRSLEMMNTSDLRVVFLDPATTTFTDEIIDLPEGLLLAEQNGQVTVLAVEKQGNGQRSGFQPSDRILSIGGRALEGKLSRFSEVYPQAKLAADSAPKREIDFQVQRPGEAAPRPVVIKLPLSLKGSMLDQP